MLMLMQRGQGLRRPRAPVQAQTRLPVRSRDGVGRSSWPAASSARRATTTASPHAALGGLSGRGRSGCTAGCRDGFRLHLPIDARERRARVLPACVPPCHRPRFLEARYDPRNTSRSWVNDVVVIRPESVESVRSAASRPRASDRDRVCRLRLGRVDPGGAHRPTLLRVGAADRSRLPGGVPADGADEAGTEARW